MSDVPHRTPSEPAFTASHALLAAALGGLLVATPACSVDGGDLPKAAPLGTSVPVEKDAGEVVDASDAMDAGVADADDGDADTADADTPDGDALDAGVADADADCVEGGIPDAGITKSVVDPTMTLEKFTDLCNMAGGTLEIHPHCGGNNTCKGFSYDSGTQVYTEHGCMGLNTCTGYSCVLPC